MADDPSFSTSGSRDNLEQAADIISRIKSDMQAMVKMSKDISSNFGSIASRGGGGSASSGVDVTGGGASTSTSAQDSGSTGYSTSQNMKLGGITSHANTKKGGGGGGGGGNGQDRSDMGPIAREWALGGWHGAKGMIGMTAAVGAAGLTGKTLLASYNDLRVGRDPALDFELSRHMARMGTGEYGRFAGHVSAAMNKYNVQDRSIMERDVATVLNQGYGQMMRGGGTATVGERRAAEAMGSAHTLGAMAGLSPESVMGGMSSMYSARSYYSLMAMGVMTRKPNGDMVSPESIVNQLRNNPMYKNASRDEIMRAMAPGAPMRVSLEQALGDENAVEMIKAGLLTAAENGRNLREGEIDKDAVDASMFGTDFTKGRDTESQKNQSQQERIMEYADDVLNGISSANRTLISINNLIANATGAFRAVIGATETAGGWLDTVGGPGGMPTTTSTITGAIGSGLGATASVLTGGALGGGAAGQSGLSLLDLYAIRQVTKGGGGGGAAAAAAAAQAGKTVPKWRQNNLTGKAKIGIGLGSSAAMTATEALMAATSGPDKDWKAWNTAGTVAGYAGSGALLGTAILPGVGTVIGSIAGGLYGAYRSFQKESMDLESYAEGSWAIEKDQTANIHQGEMILPSRIAEAVRSELRRGTTRTASSGGSNVTINLSIQNASSAEAYSFARRVKSILDNDEELISIGAGELFPLESGGF